MLDRSPASFVISPPTVQLFWAKRGRQRYLTRLRNVKLRQRERAAKKTKSNQLRCYPVWMAETDVIALLHDVELAQQRDDQSSTPQELRAAFDREWIKVAGRVIAQAARSTIQKRGRG
jgi:hypothetical protein